MRILGVNNYQVQNQNRNQTRNSSPNFKAFVKLSEMGMHVPFANIKGVMPDAEGALAIFFDHPLGGKLWKAILKSPCDPDKVAESVAQAEIPGKNADVKELIEKLVEATTQDEMLGSAGLASK